MKSADLFIHHIIEEIRRYQYANGGRSPAAVHVPKVIMDALDSEANTLQLIRDPNLPPDERKLHGVPIKADPAMRIAFMIDEEKTFSLSPRK